MVHNPSISKTAIFIFVEEVYRNLLNAIGTFHCIRQEVQTTDI